MVHNLEILKKLENFEDLPLFLQVCTEALVLNVEANFQGLENIPCSKEECKLLQKLIQNLFRTCSIDGKLSLPKGYPDSWKKPLESYFRIYQHQIAKSLAKTEILNNGTTLVDSYDWKLKWVIGSSKLASLKEPIVQVDLRCTEKKVEEISVKTVTFEGNLDQIDQLITCLNGVQKEMEM